jgi:hypothetical protein
LRLSDVSVALHGPMICVVEEQASPIIAWIRRMELNTTPPDLAASSLLFHLFDFDRSNVRDSHLSPVREGFAACSCIRTPNSGVAIRVHGLACSKKGIGTVVALLIDVIRGATYVCAEGRVVDVGEPAECSFFPSNIPLPFPSSALLLPYTALIKVNNNFTPSIVVQPFVPHLLARRRILFWAPFAYYPLRLYISTTTMINRYAAASAAILALTAASSSSKRGLCYVPSSKNPGDDSIWTSTPGSDLSWYYNYKSEPSGAFKDNKNLQFVPMLWGASDNDQGTPFLDSVKQQIASGANISYVLAFNEPDGTHATGGSNLAVELAASTWKKQIEPLKELGVKLGAPAVTGSPDGLAWLENWLKACNGGCHPDFVPVHWYGNFESMASHIGQVVGAYPNSTVWVTEWGFSNQGLQDTQSFYNQSAAMFDRWS